MTTSLQNQPGIFGVATGYMPNRGPKALQYFVDLTSGPQSWDFTAEVMRDEIEYIQAVHMDNSANAGSALTLLLGVTGQRVVCPPQAQGVFMLFCPTGSPSFTLSGPAAKFTLIFSNMPIAPSVWKTI